MFTQRSKMARDHMIATPTYASKAGSAECPFQASAMTREILSSAPQWFVQAAAATALRCAHTHLLHIAHWLKMFECLSHSIPWSSPCMHELSVLSDFLDLFHHLHLPPLIHQYLPALPSTLHLPRGQVVNPLCTLAKGDGVY